MFGFNLKPIGLTWIAGLALLAVPGPATAASPDCWVGTGDSTYQNIDCDTGSEYVVLGAVATETWTGSSWVTVVLGTGLCVFHRNADGSKGEYEEYVASAASVDDWRIRLDGAAATGSADTFRLPNHASGSVEICKSRSGYVGGVWVARALPANDSYLVWGDKGNDYIYLYGAPTTSYTITNSGRADGRDGSDHIYGSNYDVSPAEQLWGGGDTDYIYPNCGDGFIYGGGGADFITGDCASHYPYYIEGNDGVDTIDMSASGGWAEIHGGGDDDVITGTTGADEIYGNDGDDIIESGGNSNNRIEYLYGDDGIWGGTGNDTITATSGYYYYARSEAMYGGGHTGEVGDYADCNYHIYLDDHYWWDGFEDYDRCP